MKRTLCTIIWILIALPLMAQNPASVKTLAWDANTEPDLAGYRLYRSTTSGTYTGTPYVTFPCVAAGNCPTQGQTLPSYNGTFFFVLTAFNAGGLESGHSNEVSTTINIAPANPRLHEILNQIALGYETIGAGMRQLAVYVAEQPTQAAANEARGLRWKD